ncbi:MAG: hypothetical protein EOO71_19480 [Myxococcaceae bacterium]|nr:MAG: hypothetical protein EOO71_19480 [Myxococcaceae bacterium]
MRVGRVGLGLVLVAGVAHGGWTVTQTQLGTPRDVTVYRPGHFGVATNQQLFISRDGGVSTLSGEMSGSFLQGSDCVVGIRTDSSLQSVAGCSPDEGKHLFPDIGTEYKVNAVRLTPDGGVGYATAAPVPAGPVEFRSSVLAPQGSAQWGQLTMPMPGALSLAPLAVLPPQADGVPHALYSVTTGGANLVWYRGAAAEVLRSLGSPQLPQAQSVVLLPGVTPSKPLAFFGNNSSLFRGTLDGPTWPFDPVLTGVGSVDALAFDVANGSAAGVGFGLMLVKKDGRVRAYSAEPVAPPALPGSVWRENTSFPTGITQAAMQMSCWGASYCVAILNGGVQNVVVYQNERTPDLGSVPANVVIEEGRTQALVLNPRDGDGDAVRVTATPRDSTGLLTITSGPPPVGDNGLTLSLTADADFCASQQAFIDVVASDGLAAHDTTKTVALQVKHTTAPAAPSSVAVDVEGGVFFAGGPAGTLIPTRGASGCAPVRYTWMTPARAPNLIVTDTVATLNPALTRADRCKTDSTFFTYEVRAYDGELTSTTATSVPLEFLPWGPPEAPFPNPPAPLFSGTSLSPQSLHLCAGTPGLPLTTWWSRLDTTPGVSVTALKDPGTPQPAVGETPVEGPAVVIESQGCTDTAVRLRAVHHVTVKGHTLVGPESIVDVTVKPRWVPLDTASVKPVLTEDGSEEFKYRGRLQTPGFNCVASRNVHTVVTLETSDTGQVLRTQTLTGASGDVELELPQTCGSATYNLRIRVQELTATGTTVTSESLQPLPREARGVELGEVDGELVATCEEGARGTLTQTFPEGACTAVDLDWSYVKGPGLEDIVSTDVVAMLATKDTQLESLVGEFVTVSVNATGEGASGAAREHSVQIGARPFVSLGRRVETGSGSDSSQVGVSVFLRNDTACGVSSVRYEEVPSGAEVVLDSVRLNGQPMNATALEGGGFAVEPVPLDAGATATLTYVIRPALLGTPTFSGVATLRGIRVSQAEAPPPSTSGCGCSGSGSGVTAFGLGALAWMARRRRGVRARS